MRLRFWKTGWGGLITPRERRMTHDAAKDENWVLYRAIRRNIDENQPGRSRLNRRIFRMRGTRRHEDD